MKIGILFPLSKVYPQIGLEFMDGLHSFFKQEHLTGEIEVFKEGVGFGGIEKDIYQKAESLLIAGDVDVLIGFIDEKVLSIIHPLLQATGKIMIVVNAGANYPLNWIPQPSIIHLNLQHAFLCWLSGGNAAESGNRKAAFASTYYDCGYLQAAAIVNRFMERGGSLLYNYINNNAYNEAFEIVNLIQFLSANPGCRNLLCVFDRLPASLFYSLLEEKAKDSHLHLFVSPMMLEAIVDDNNKSYSFAVDGYLPWYKSFNSEGNVSFKAKLAKPASMFSLLGWETAMVLQQLRQHSGTGASAEDIILQLASVTLNSPRGGLQFDPETQFYLAPVAKCRLEPGDTKPSIEWKTDLEDDWRAFTSKPTEGHVTGWTNTYLCY